jgi:hypothetical protein
MIDVSLDRCWESFEQMDQGVLDVLGCQCARLQVCLSCNFLTVLREKDTSKFAGYEDRLKDSWSATVLRYNNITYDKLSGLNCHYQRYW